jgi:CBS domain containing-hemolysin-like protein
MGYNLAMIQIISGILLIVIGMLSLSLQRLYSAVPVRELKRLAAQGDRLASGLYRVVAYGASGRLFLWIIFSASLSTGLVLISSIGQIWFLIVLLATLTLTVWLWTARLTSATAQFAVAFSSPIVKVLSYVHRPLIFVVRHVRRLRIVDSHSGLYEKDDFIHLVRQQKEQPDSRIDPSQLELIENTLKAHDWQAADLVTPWKELKQVEASDKIGPILLSELYKSGQNAFVVYKDEPENVIGSLALADAVSAKEGGKVSDIMRPNITYVHENFSLHQVFQAFASSGRPMVVVINSFEEAVGIITLQNALIKLLGEMDDEPLAYEDSKTIANWRPQPEPVAVPVVDDIPPDTSSEPTEVVE